MRSRLASVTCGQPRYRILNGATTLTPPLDKVQYVGKDHGWT